MKPIISINDEKELIIYMQKIKYGVLDKLLRADLSRAEMDFILHISHYQDDTGCVSGIYYRDICEALQI